MQLIPRRSKRIRSYIYLNLKFHDYSSFLTVFHITTVTEEAECLKPKTFHREHHIHYNLYVFYKLYY